MKYSSLSRKKLAKIKEHEPLNDGFTVFHKMSDGTKDIRYIIMINVIFTDKDIPLDMN